MTLKIGMFHKLVPIIALALLVTGCSKSTDLNSAQLSSPNLPSEMLINDEVLFKVNLVSKSSDSLNLYVTLQSKTDANWVNYSKPKLIPSGMKMEFAYTPKTAGETYFRLAAWQENNFQSNPNLVSNQTQSYIFDIQAERGKLAENVIGFKNAYSDFYDALNTICYDENNEGDYYSRRACYVFIGKALTSITEFSEKLSTQIEELHFPKKLREIYLDRARIYQKLKLSADYIAVTYCNSNRNFDLANVDLASCTYASGSEGVSSWDEFIALIQDLISNSDEIKNYVESKGLVFDIYTK